MSSSLYTSVSGLLAHQRKLDVVANNLANLNTVGYKSQQIHFADLISTDVNQATGSSAATRVGGRNPNQIGNGVKVTQITRNGNQGVLQTTGRALDFSILGEGFFTVTDGSNQYFTRDGSFSINSAGYLVSPAVGSLVVRSGSLGEPTADSIGFQTPGQEGIFVPLGSTLPASATTSAEFTGNLPASAVPPRAHVLTSENPFQVGGVPAASTTLLNDLDSSTADYIGGDSIILSGTDVDGTPFNLSLNVDGSTTLGDLVDAVNSQLNLATASLDTQGNLVLTAADTGESSLEVLLSNDPGNTGAIDFSNNTLSTTTPGKNGDQVFTTIQIYDSRGQAQTLTAEFTKVSTDQWDAHFSMTTANGTMVDDVVSGIEFNVDGTFRQINGMGTGDAAITLNFDDINGNQTVDLDFSKMSHHAANFGAFFDQDGYPTGTLQQLSVTGSGVLEAIATNGQRIAVAQLAITSFRNPQGLTSEGNNYFAASIASGLPQSGAGQMNGRGEVISGNLEQSNVDVAFEFTQLIVAQRGFSANARSVTVTDNVLQELTNIVR